MLVRRLSLQTTLILLMLAAFLPLSLEAQSSRYEERAWSRINLPPPGPVEAVADNPVQRYPAIIKVGALPPQDSPDVQVTTATNVTQSENSIAVSPLNNLVVLNSNNSSDYPLANIFGASGFMSTDGGLTWTGSAQGTGGTNKGDPSVAIDLSGRFYNNYIASDGGNGTAYSANNGATWTHVQVTPIPEPGGLADKNHMWVDNSPTSPYAGRLYAAWTDFGGSFDSEIMVSRSTNGGLNWSTKVAVSTAINAGSHNQGVNVQTGPNGEVYVTWAVYDAFPARETALGFAKSTDGGATWQPAVRAITNIQGIRTMTTGDGLLGGKDMRTASFPSMAVNMQNGNMYIVWTNIGVPGVNSGTERDVYMAKSINGGTTWGTAVRVNQDALNNGKDQWFPWIACDPISGALVVAFYDSRDFAGNDQANTYAAVSYNGGTTWEDFRVSDASWNGDGSGTGFSSNYAGDYIGIAVRNGRAYPVWTDRRASGGRLSTWVSPFLVYPPNAGFVKGIVTSGGSPLTGVVVDFTDPVTQIPSTTDATGYYKASASVNPATTSLLTIRAQKFGYVTTTETVTVVRADTVTRNISLVTAPGGTLQVHAYRNDNSGIRTGVQVSFAGQVVVSDSTDAVTGLLNVPLPTGSYDVVVDPPSPYGTRRFNGVVINVSQTTQVDALVRYVLEPSPTAVRDTLVVGQIHAKTLSIANTTPDTIRFRITDDNALLRAARPGKPRPTAVRQYQAYELPKGAKDEHPGIAAPDGRGGPDAFGYEWVDSDEPGGPTFSWVDISGTGTLISGWAGTTDDGRKTIGLPFSFPFYGISNDSVKVTTNGWISFATTSTNNTYSNTAIPTTAEPNNAIYMFWDDLNLTSSGTVHYYNDVANTRFIIQYTNVPSYSGTGVYTFQVILRPNGTALVQYLTMQLNLNSATIGIENGTGTDGLQVVFNSSYVHDNLAIQYFVPDAPWISENPITGTLPPSAVQNITVTFDATGLVTGNLYNALLSVDPDHGDVTGTIDVPASLKIQLASSAVLILNKSTITFPATQVNTTRRDTIVAKNGGATTLTISSITRTNTDYSVSPASAVLAPGDSVKVPVIYTPTAVGSDTGRVIFLSNSQGTPQMDVILNGTAIGAPSISVTPANLLDTLQTGTSHAKQFTITNTTAEPTTPLMVSLSEGVSWLTVAPASDTLAGGTGAAFTVTFDAAALPIGVVNTVITVSSNDPATPTTTVACTLRVVGGPVIAVRPDSVKKTVAPGAQGTDTLVIRNTGSLTLNWSLGEVAGSAPASRPAISFTSGPILPKGIDDGKTSGPVTEGSGGPDAYGYRWKDSDEPDGPTYNWIDISGTGAALDSASAWIPTGTFRGGDEGYYAVTLPFTFDYYGVPRTTLYISSNGFVAFQIPTGDTYTNEQFPTSSGVVSEHLGAFWDDLEVRGPGRVYYGASGGNFVVQYNQIPRFSSSTPNYTFEVILKPSGEWVYQYQAMGINAGTIISASIGMENSGGTIGLSVVHNAAYLHNNLAIAFGRGIPWLTENPLSGSITPNDSVKVVLAFNTTGLANGVYNGTLAITSNDFNQNPKNVPVRLTVGNTGTTVSVDLSPGWNMVSNPLTTASDSVRQLFPTASFAYAFAYSSGYTPVYKLLNGKGYWEKFPAAISQSISGAPRTSESIPIVAGWNIVGSISSTIDTSATTTVPAGLRGSPFFEFGTAGYTATQTIIPGKAYWMKSSASGTLTLTGAGPTLATSASPAGGVTSALEQMSLLRLSDASGHSQILYIGRGSEETATSFELPPIGPDGVFDVRFESQRMVEVFDPAAGAARDFAIALRSVTFPLTLAWEVRGESARLTVRDGVNGAIVPARTLVGSGSVVLAQTALSRLILTASPDGVPTEFALEQNYPNPFNPSTRLAYALAEPASVTLSVYDLLGRQVRTLVSEQQDAGYYSAEWNGMNDAGMAASSGIYFCRIEATAQTGTSYRSVIKMVLMK